MGRIDFKDFYEKNYFRSFYFVKSYVHDEMIAEDIVMESLAKCWELDDSKQIEITDPFLFTILKNKSLNYLKQEIIRKSTYEKLSEKSERELMMRISSLRACDPQDLFSSEIKKIINETLASLPKQAQQIFQLSRFENRPVKEIAQRMGITVKGVEYHITRTLKILRIALKDYLPILYFILFK